MTNLAVISTLVGKGDHVLSDERNHASIVDGCRLSGAEITRFTHNDMADLERHLQRLPDDSRKLIVVDAVYSMDGDIAPLEALIALRNRHPNALLMVHEAHSLGVLGNLGRGIEEHFGCIGQIDILMGTLSKTIPPKVAISPARSNWSRSFVSTREGSCSAPRFHPQPRQLPWRPWNLSKGRGSYAARG